MSKFRRWGLSVLTMVSVATAVLLVTGWGSAMASSVTSVIVKNPATRPVNVRETRPVTVKGSVGIAGTPSVSVSNPTSNPANVHETGTVTVNGSVGITGTPSVNVSNLPAAPTTQEIVHGSGHVTPSTYFKLVDHSIDLSAYRSVTLYLTMSVATAPGESCSLSTYDSSGASYSIETVNTGGTPFYSVTVDPAPPNMDINCYEDEGLTFDYHFMLTGRTG